MTEHTPPANVTPTTTPYEVALVADRGALGPVAVTARDGARITFSRPDGTFQKSGASRLFWAGEATVTTLAELDAVFAAVTNLASDLAFDRIHAQLVAEGGANQPLGPEALARLAGMTPDVLNGYALALGAFEDALYFKVRDGAFLPEHVATITHTLAKRAERRALDARVAHALPRIVQLLRGELNVFSAVAARQAIADVDPALEDDLVHVAALGRESPHAPLADGLLEALQRTVDESSDILPPTCRADGIQRVISRQVEDLLVRLGVLERHPNLAPLRAGVPRRFDDATLEEAARVVGAPPAPPSLTFAGLRPYAIDDAETTEIDDAIAIDPDDPRRVHVLIADAGAWVTRGSVLDAEARERLTTLYLPDERIPMLPPAIADEGASLLDGVARSALVISATITSDGTPVGLTVARALVSGTRQLTYDAVEEALTSGGQLDPETQETLRHLEKLSVLHRTSRHDHGAVTFQRPEINYALSGKGNIELKVGTPLSRARQLVSEFMVLACHAVAKFCEANAIPCLYRSQAKPDELPDPPDPKTGRVDDPVKQNDLMRRLKPSLLTTDPRLHWTLGVHPYAQVTSPIRRYTDLVMHQQLVTWLDTGRPAYTKAALDEVIAHISRTMPRVKRADQDSRRLYALRWFEQEEGRVFDAVVLRDLGKRYLIDITLIGWHEALQLRGRRRPGQHLRVRVDHIDIASDTVTFREA